jgi:hypothetical protein
MKKLFESWRGYINEGPPLAPDGYAEYGEDPRMPSVGYGLAKKTPSFVEDISQLMSKTKDSWVIITVANLEKIKEEVQTEKFKSWLASRKYPKNSKVIVVGSESYENDLTSPDWILHDIIGHSAGLAFLKQRGYNYGASWLKEDRSRERSVVAVHNYLKRIGAPITGSTEPIDDLYDLFASIILGDITFDEIDDLIEDNLIENVESIKEIFDFCVEWVNSIPSDNTKATVIEPW